MILPYVSTETFLASVKSKEFEALSQKLTDLGVERIAGLYDAVHSFGEGPATDGILVSSSVMTPTMRNARSTFDSSGDIV